MLGDIMRSLQRNKIKLQKEKENQKSNCNKSSLIVGKEQRLFLEENEYTVELRNHLCQSKDCLR